VAIAYLKTATKNSATEKIHTDLGRLPLLCIGIMIGFAAVGYIWDLKAIEREKKAAAKRAAAKRAAAKRAAAKRAAAKRAAAKRAAAKRAAAKRAAAKRAAASQSNNPYAIPLLKNMP